MVVDQTKEKIKELINKAYKVMYNNPPKCIKYSKQALEIANRIKDRVDVGMSYMHIGLGNYHQSNYSIAMENYRKALLLFEKEKYYYGLRVVLENIGNIYSYWGEYEKSLGHYLRSLSLSKKYIENRTTAITLNNIGNIYRKIGKNEKALDYFKQALKIAETENYDYCIAITSNNIGLIYMGINDYNKALECFFKAKEINEKIKNYESLIHSVTNIGKTHELSGNLQKAMGTYQDALQIAENLGNKNRISYILSLMSEIYESQNDYLKALEFLNKSFDLAVKENFKDQLSTIYHSFADIYAKLRKYKKSLFYHKKYVEIKEQIINIESNKKIAEMQAKYDSEIYHLKNIELTERIEEEVKKSKQQQQQLVQKSKLESLGRIAAGIAHEINQPLSVISFRLDNILDEMKDRNFDINNIQERLSSQFEDIERIQNIIDHIRTFSREQDKFITREFNINESIKNARKMVNQQYIHHGIEFRFDLQDNLENISGNPYRLEQVILNLFSNAKDALEEKSRNSDSLEKIISVRTFMKDKRILLEVEDNGIGIPANILEKIMEPFFTTKKSGEGTGLGLSISFGIIKEMGGEIFVESEIGEYTKMKIVWEKI